MMRAAGIAAVLAAAVLTSSCGLKLQNAGLGTGHGGPSKRITAVFSDAGRLPLGGVVRAGQAEVGRVAAIETRDFQAVVALDIARDFPVPARTRAQLQLSSPLGEAFVMLVPPAQAAGGPPLADGSVIPIQHTTRGPDVEDTLAAVGVVLNGSGLDQARTVVSELSTALRGREQKVPELLHELDSVLGSLDRRRGEITGVIDSMHAASEQLARNRPLMEAAFTEIRPGIDVLLDERERFTQLLANTASLSTAANDLAQRTTDSLATQVHRLRPVLADLRKFDDGLGRTLESMTRFSQLFRQATPGDYVLFNGTLDLPGTIGEILLPQDPAPAPPQDPVHRLLEGGVR